MNKEVKTINPILVSVVSSLLTALALATVAIVADAARFLVNESVIQTLSEDPKFVGRVADSVTDNVLPLAGDALQQAPAKLTIQPRLDGSIGIPIPSGYAPVGCQWHCTEGVAIAVWRSERDGDMWHFAAYNGHNTKASKVELTLLLLPAGESGS